MSLQKKKVNRCKEYLLDIFFPRHVKCIFCDEELNGKEHNDCCQNCLNSLPFIKTYCERCGTPMPVEREGVCAFCNANNYDFVMARSIFEYTGDVVTTIHNYKYHNQKFLCEPLGEFLSDYLARWDISPEVVCAVPLHEAREKSRGYNQAKLLAEVVARNFNLPYVEAVKKIKDNPSQTALTIKERQANVKDVYAINKDFKKDIENKTILLIDDIYTTGATANEISKILKSAKAKAIYVLTVAHAIGNQDQEKNKNKNKK